MAIPASQIVSISPRVLQAGGTDLVLNGLFLTENELVTTDAMIRSFATATDVMDYFGATSAEYAAAQVYFAGYNNSYKKPSSVVFGRRVLNSTGATLTGSEFTGTLADLQAISAGTLNISIDGAEVALTGIDFSEVTSFSGAASVLNSALSAASSTATVQFSSVTNSFVITSGTLGSAGSISYAEASESAANVGAVLNLTESAGATVIPGVDAMTVANNMAAIKAHSENWATFTPLYEASDAEALALAAWAGLQGVEYLCVLYSNADAMTAQNDTTSIAYQLEQAEAGATTLIYGNAQDAAFIMGSVASIDWERRNSTITLAFKRQNGLAANVTNATVASVLEGKHVNFIGEYATRNDEFVWLYPGRMYGEYNFIDPFVNAIWFNSAIQTAIMSGLATAGRVPYNEDGYTLIRAWIQDPIDRAFRNGVIDTGMQLSNAQIAQVASEAGLDISQELQANGYYLQVEDAGPSVRTNRESPNLSLWYCYAGSVQRVQLSSTLLI